MLLKGMMGSAGMDGMDGAGGMNGMEQTGKLQQLFEGLPTWASALVITLAVLAVAAALGWVFGKLYASIRYPDPEKHSVLSAPVKVIFLVVLAVCTVWLYFTMFKNDPDTLSVDGSSSMIEGEGGGGNAGGGGAIGGGGMIMNDGATVAFMY
ncbi:MAG: hypothetical protein RR320_03325 [Oscillospiraceae bacterium]